MFPREAGVDISVIALWLVLCTITGTDVIGRPAIGVQLPGRLAAGLRNDHLHQVGTELTVLYTFDAPSDHVAVEDIDHYLGVMPDYLSPNDTFSFCPSFMPISA